MCCYKGLLGAAATCLTCRDSGPRDVHDMKRSQGRLRRVQPVSPEHGRVRARMPCVGTSSRTVTGISRSEFTFKHNSSTTTTPSALPKERCRVAQTSDTRQLHNVALTSNTTDNRSRKRGRNLDTLQTPSTSSIACAACCANCVRYVLAYAGTAYIQFPHTCTDLTAHRDDNVAHAGAPHIRT